MSAHDDSPLDSAIRVCRLLSAGPHPLSVDGGAFAGVPDQRLTAIELIDVFPRLRAGDADRIWRFAAAEAQAGHHTWRVMTAALVSGELRRLARALARWARLAAIPDCGAAEAVVLAEFMAAAVRADLNAPSERHVFREVLAETRDHVRIRPTRPSWVHAGGDAR